MTTRTEDFVGCGLYTLGQAARLLRVHPAMLRYWVGEADDVDPIVPRQITDDRVLTFAELMELHFVKMFRDEGVSYQAIRKAAKAAANKFHSAYPFTLKRFDTDGKTIFATLRKGEKSKTIVEDLEKCQLVFPTIIKPFFKKLDYSTTNDIERFWPMKKTGRIVLDPTRRFGQPIDSESGVSTATIASAVTAGDGQDVKTVAKWFDISVEAVKAAVQFEKSLAS
jgi:uncharacterized protein (DUF433 family)/DNA-binding transcriptional MerR regulator